MPTDSSFWTFRWENEDTDEWKILHSFLWNRKKWKNKRKMSDAIIWGALNFVVKKVEQYIAWEVKRLLEEEHDITSISTEIEKVTISAGVILEEDFKKISVAEKILPSIHYRIYVFWILEKLKSAGYNLYKERYQDVPREHGEDIYNILADRVLTTLFMVCKSLRILDFSENTINQFEEENELKVLDTSHKEVRKGLETWKDKNKTLQIVEHKRAKVIDDYYDDIDLWLDRKLVDGWKRSIRLRRKVFEDGEIEDFYTIKRKLTDDNTDESIGRRCLEKEFKIKKRKKFKKLLWALGLKKSRSKTKDRKSYSISYYDDALQQHIDAKIDIDTYEDIPEFIEVECDNDEAIPHIIQHLWLEKKMTLKAGSRGLFRYYDIYDQYKNCYEVNEETGDIVWEDGDIWNIQQGSEG